MTFHCSLIYETLISQNCAVPERIAFLLSKLCFYRKTFPELYLKLSSLETSAATLQLRNLLVFIVQLTCVLQLLNSSFRYHHLFTLIVDNCIFHVMCYKLKSYGDSYPHYECIVNFMLNKLALRLNKLLSLPH